MYHTKVYITTDSTAQKASEKYYGYVMEYAGQTREGFGSIVGTYHQTVLTALAEALERFNQTCEICVYSDNIFVLNMLENNLSEWAGNEFLTKKNKPIANQEEWMRIWRLSQKHLILTEPGRHGYTSWLLDEIEKRKEKKHV